MADLTKLNKITKELKDLSYLRLDKTTPGDISYLDESGKEVCKGYYLYKEGYVAVQQAFIKKGNILPNHSHKEKEYLIVYKGKIKVTINNQEQKTYNTGDCVYFQPHTLHCVEGLEDTWMIGITVPASEVYPNE